ncbi:MAG: hypothetical protein F4X40_00005 [Chloroflexi bacterium]|nr:hypothetical protein [Chloroflexota bacterium]
MPGAEGALQTTTTGQIMFQKPALDALFDELDNRYAGTPDYDQLLRDAHLGIALSDAGREYESQVDDRVATLIATHKTID